MDPHAARGRAQAEASQRAATECRVRNLQVETERSEHSPRLASPRLASPRLASPRLASPRLASPRLSPVVALKPQRVRGLYSLRAVPQIVLAANNY